MSENQEINKWLQHINNIVWIVTSFLVTLHFMVIRSTFDPPISCFIKDNPWCLNLILFIIVFSLLWIIPALFVLSMIRVSEKLSDLLNGNPLDTKKLKSNIRFDLKELLSKEFWGALKFPWAWIIITFTVFFLGTWGWIFFICIKKCN